MTNTERQVRRVQSVANALRVLDALARTPGPAGVTELARGLQLGKSTVHLLLRTLEDHRYVRRAQPGPGYQLGIAGIELGAAAAGQFHLGPELAVPMERLAADTGEAVSLAILADHDALIVQRFESEQVLRTSIRVGTRMPLHASAAGKALLAQLTPEEFDDWLAGRGPLPALTGHTTVTAAALVEELAAVRRRGLAVSVDEYIVGVTALGVAVPAAAGMSRYALSLAAPTTRADLAGWEGPVRRTAARLSELLRGLPAAATGGEPGRPAGTTAAGLHEVVW